LFSEGGRAFSTQDTEDKDLFGCSRFQVLATPTLRLPWQRGAKKNNQLVFNNARDHHINVGSNNYEQS
jgi:hypothetical protein